MSRYAARSEPVKRSVMWDPRAERALLASASLGGAEVLSNLIGWVEEDWFGVAAHALTWRVLSGLIERGLPIDSVVLQSELETIGMKADDARTICEDLARLVPNAARWKHYASVVEKFRKRRKGIAAAHAMLAQFEDMTADPAETLAMVEAAMFDLHARRARGGARHRKEFVDPVLDAICEAFEHRGHVIGGIGTGYTDLDRIYIKGLRKGHFWLVGAPPGGGKTVMLSKILDNIARGEGDYHEFKQAPVPVLLVSLEMSGAELVERDVVRLTKVTLKQAQSGMMSRAVHASLSDGCKVLREAPFYILYMPGATIQEVRVQVRYEVARLGIGVVGLDYVQCLKSGSKAARESRTIEMQEISQGLDAMAAELEIPVIAASQLKVEAYTGRPKLEHLRESAQLAQDADLVMLLSPWKKATEKKEAAGRKRKLDEHDRGTPFEEPDEEAEDEEGDFMAADVVKNRHGGNTVGKLPIKLKWNREYFDFVSTCDRLFDSSGNNTQAAA